MIDCVVLPLTKVAELQAELPPEVVPIPVRTDVDSAYFSTIDAQFLIDIGVFTEEEKQQFPEATVFESGVLIFDGTYNYIGKSDELPPVAGPGSYIIVDYEDYEVLA